MLGSPVRDRRAERRAATREEIVAAAWELARDHGLTGLTLRDIGAQVGMRGPSLYTHFESKNAIYDAMFAQAWGKCEEAMLTVAASLPEEPRAALRKVARAYFAFAVEDQVRYQLMSQRAIPGFRPTEQSYAVSVRTHDRLRAFLAGLGAGRAGDVDLYTALLEGLVGAQLANDPGGRRWARLVDRAVDMYADNVGIPPLTGSSR
jgi:AcrR family transcriptional regulator